MEDLIIRPLFYLGTQNYNIYLGRGLLEIYIGGRCWMFWFPTHLGDMTDRKNYTFMFSPKKAF